jgi:peptide/nickel transport system permease protein/oligopeptide transport system permease protein
LAPWLPGYDPTGLGEGQFQPPSGAHWCGTDIHGRDVFSRVIYGARISLLVGGVGAFVSLVIGSTWGALSGYLGGKWDNAMMRVVDVLYSLPSTIFLMALIATVDGFVKDRLAGAEPKWPATAVFLAHWAGRFSLDVEASARMLFLFFGLGAISWLTMARIVRGEVLSLRTKGFVDASRAMGAGHWHILKTHILPNVSGIILVYLALSVPSVILYESFLSYLGMGVQAPQASLGSLIAEGASQINSIRVYWWLLVFPGGGLVAALVALNFFADGLRDALDPRSRTM